MDITDLAIFLLFASCGLLLTTIGFAVAWVRARERVLKLRSDASELRDVARAERVDQAVEAIALEVERIGEQQRFLTKLLADNASPGTRRTGSASGEFAPTAIPPRVVTPH